MNQSDWSGKEDFNMDSDDKQFFQCLECGEVYKLKIHYNIENDLYTKMSCPHCRDETMHLWVGNKPEDKYIYYDPVLDSRYYKYNTK